MAKLSESKIVAGGGLVTATVLDEVSPERLVLYLIKGEYAAKYSGVANSTPEITRPVRNEVLFPLKETSS
tara:strand:+ start:477 stop:686 length:210 start_codon:yes stop_codon:yes gene_type:complete